MKLGLGVGEGWGGGGRTVSSAAEMTVPLPDDRNSQDSCIITSVLNAAKTKHLRNN